MDLVREGAHPNSLIAVDIDTASCNAVQLSDYGRRINIVVVVKNRRDHFKRFVRNLGRLLKSGHYNVVLSVFDWQSDDVDVGDVLRGSGVPHHLIQRSGNFSKVTGLHALINSAAETDVIFIADIDFHLPSDVLGGILKYVRNGKTVYMPIPWMVQMPDVDCNQVGLPENCTTEEFIDSFEGNFMDMPSQLNFATGGFGPIAFYKEDFVGLDGLNVKTFGVRKDYEDTDLAYRFFSCNMLIIRGPTHGFVHLPHGFGWHG